MVGKIPAKFTCEGTYVSSKLTWTASPGTQSFTLIAESTIVDTDGDLHGFQGCPLCGIDSSYNENGLSACPDKPLMLSSFLFESPNHYRYFPDSFDICASPLGVSFSVLCFRLSQYSVIHCSIVNLI